MPDIVQPIPDELLDVGNADRAELDYFAAIEAQIAKHPRSQQKEIGPSEIGINCDRRIGYILCQYPQPDKVNWKAEIGTAVHAYLENAFQAYNLDHAEFGGQERYLTENRIAISDVPFLGYPLSGHCDLYDRVTGFVVDHKGLPLDTPIPTPEGWTTQGDLKVGDVVFGRDGQQCNVTRVYPVQHRDCYRTTFSDGTSMVTDDVQQLTVSVNGKRELTASVAELRSQLREPSERGQLHLRLYNPGVLDLPNIDLVVHPYVLGCWLGDGSKCSGQVSKPDDELFTLIEGCGYTVGPADARGMTRTVRGLQTQLRKLGLQWVSGRRVGEDGKKRQEIAGRKRIPQQYLRAGYGQRLALLQGLMDSDGSWNKCRKQAVFTTTDEGLAEGVRELVATLGWRSRIYPQKATGFGKTVTAYHVEFVPFGDNPFRLTRKARLVRREGTTSARYRLIKSIEPVDSVPTRCIDVDADDHLYLAGPDMIPVHNCVGPNQLKKYRREGPSQQYRVQANCYGYGWRQAGFPVSRVAIAFLPRNGDWNEAYFWSEPYDELLALNALARLSGIAQMTSLAGPLALQFLQTADSYCPFCPFFKRGSDDPQKGCPGHPGSVAVAAQKPALTFNAA